MTSATFAFNPRDIAAVQEYLKSVPYGALRPALEAYVIYVIGDSSHGLKHDDPYKFVERSRAYGKVSDAPAGYFSWKQFRYVAALTHGFTEFPPRKSPTEQSNAWTYHTTNNGYAISIDNPTAGAYYTRDDEYQPRQLTLVGWRKISKVVEDNNDGAMRHANAEVKNFLDR